MNTAENIKPKSKLWNLAFAVTLIMTLLSGKWLWMARIAWTLLALMFVVDLRYAFYALFFYAAWFQPTGFLPKIPFALKHFHLAAFLAVAAQAISGSYSREAVTAGFRKLHQFSLIFLILGIGLLNYVRFGMPIQALRSPLNILVILVILGYLFTLLEKFSKKRFKMIHRALCFFLAGVGIQVLIAFQNTVSGSNYLNMPLIHNNHIGILCAFSSFLGIGTFFSGTKSQEKRLWGLVTLIVISAAFASCSRTAWFGFVAGLLVLFTETWRYRSQGPCTGMRKRHPFIALLLLTAVIGIVCLLNPEVRIRFSSLPQLVDPVYLKYTLQDFQNFGFLGFFRLLQMYELYDILMSQPFLGVGFTRRVMDFHGFYFCVLGATGFTGLVLLALFVKRILLDALRRSPCDGREIFFLRLGALSAFSTLLVCSFMETYIVQFSAWITLWTVMALADAENRTSVKGTSRE